MRDMRTWIAAEVKLGKRTITMVVPSDPFRSPHSRKSETQPNAVPTYGETKVLGGSLDIVPDEWGPKRSTGLADIALTRCNADTISFCVPDHFFLVLLTPQSERETRTASSRGQVFAAQTGTVEAIPAGADFFGRWNVPKENILIGIQPGQLSMIAEREFDVGQIEVSPFDALHTDRTALQLAMLIRNEMGDELPANRLYHDALTTALVVQIMRLQYAAAGASMPQVHRGGLSPIIEKRVMEYLHNRLGEDLSVSDLAECAGLSYSHFLRAFRQTVGIPPHKHLRNLRVKEAERLLIETDLPLREVARRTGFSSQSHLTTMMKKSLHVTPGELRATSRARVYEVRNTDRSE